MYGCAPLRLSLLFALPPMNPRFGWSPWAYLSTPDCGVRCCFDRRRGKPNGLCSSPRPLRPTLSLNWFPSRPSAAGGFLCGADSHHGRQLHSQRRSTINANGSSIAMEARNERGKKDRPFSLPRAGRKCHADRQALRGPGPQPRRTLGTFLRWKVPRPGAKYPSPAGTAKFFLPCHPS